MIGFSDDQLSAYLDGEADAVTAEGIDRALEANQALAERLETLRLHDRWVRDGIDESLGPVPSRLSDLLERGSPPSNVLGFRPRPLAPMIAFRRMAPWAAALIVGVFAGVTFQATRSQTLIVDSASGPVAGRSLAAALSTARAGAPLKLDAATVRIFLSFEARGGGLCRQFGATFQNVEATGVACRQGQAWRIDGWTTGGAPQSDGYRTAAGPDDPVSAAELNRIGVIDLLDGAAETAAINAGWKPRTGRQ